MGKKVRSRLNTEEELRSSIAKIRERLASFEQRDSSGDFADRGKSDESIMLEYGLREMFARRLQEQELALARVQSRKRIVCESCGMAIAPERLAVVPTAVRCTRCQAIYENNRFKSTLQIASHRQISPRHPFPKPHEVLVVQSDNSGLICSFLAFKGEDAQIAVRSDELSSVLVCPIWSTYKVKQLEAVEELEFLLNKHGLKENELQRFFEEHPEFLLGIEYETLYPQVVFEREDEDELRPDFVLKPLAGVSYEPKIVDLKLPCQPIIKPTPRRQGLYAGIYEGVRQLNTYRRYFEDPRNRQYVTQKLGFTAYRPRLALVVGKSIEPVKQEIRADILESIIPVELVTYNDLINQYKHMLAKFC